MILHLNGFLVATFNRDVFIYVFNNLFQAFQLEKEYII